MLQLASTHTSKIYLLNLFIASAHINHLIVLDKNLFWTT